MFRYNDDERKALADAVPDAGLDALGDWERLAHPDEFRAARTAYIARQLERLGRECLKEGKRPRRTAKDDSDEARIIARDARNMRRRLVKPTPNGTTFALEFFGRGWLNDGKGGYIPGFYRHEIFLALLDELISNGEEVVEGLAARHANDLFDGRHHPAFARFVDAAIIFWQLWTNKPAGASHQVGPASRFMCAAVNPLLAFAEEKQGLTLRRGGPLTESVAGRLIEEIRRADPPLNGDGTKSAQ